MKETKGWCYKCQKEVVILKDKVETCKECKSTLVRITRKD